MQQVNKNTHHCISIIYNACIKWSYMSSVYWWFQQWHLTKCYVFYRFLFSAVDFMMCFWCFFKVSWCKALWTVMLLKCDWRIDWLIDCKKDTLILWDLLTTDLLTPLIGCICWNCEAQGFFVFSNYSWWHLLLKQLFQNFMSNFPDRQMKTQLVEAFFRLLGDFCFSPSWLEQELNYQRS